MLLHKTYRKFKKKQSVIDYFSQPGLQFIISKIIHLNVKEEKDAKPEKECDVGFEASQDL